MANPTVAVPLPSFEHVAARQVQQPAAWQVQYSADDTDNHDYKVEGRGKAKFTIAIDNTLCNQALTVTVYGSMLDAASVGDKETHQIGSSISVSASSKGYETWADPFPYYFFRFAHATGPSAANLTVDIYGVG